MEIRALTGFNEQTRRRYGRSYSPINGNCTALGSPIGFGIFYSDETIEELKKQDIPPQDVEVEDETGRKRIFTIDNANALISLIERGFRLVSSFRNRSGNNVTVVPDYTGGSGSGSGSGGGGSDDEKKAGINVTTLLGGAIAAYIVFSLLMSKK